MAVTRVRLHEDTHGREPRAWRELVLCGGIAALVCCFVLLVVPPGGDLAAHLYRTLLVRQGVLVWDNLWFAGQYPLFSYSLLYYLLAAVVGNTALGIVAIVGAASLFASLLLGQWGTRARWSARSFALLSAGQLFTGAYPYALGFAAMLATLWALSRQRPWLGGLCALLTLGFSPLAFLFLALVLVALFLRSLALSTRVLVTVAAVALGAGVEIAVLVVFPTPGLYYPYGIWRLLAGLAVAGLGTALALRSSRGAPLASIFCVWAVASVVAYLVPSPIGHNLARPATLVFPLMLLAASLARFRPRWLASTALAAALVSNLAPYLSMIPVRSTDPAGRASFWAPTLAYLGRHPAGPGFRVEVVPTANHWEAYYLPHAGFALARGWYRQLDMSDNPALYRNPLTPSGYRHWLRNAGVRYVILPHTALEAVEAQREATLLTSGRSGLRRIFTDASATVYELRNASPILTGPPTATVTLLNHQAIAGRITRAGDYLLHIHYTPYWRVVTGSVCISAAPDGMTTLHIARPGAFSLHAIESVDGVVTSLLDGDHHNCLGR